MKKEELKFTSETKPIKISFIPLSLQLPFNLSLRLQLAFYRGLFSLIQLTKPARPRRRSIPNPLEARTSSLSLKSSISVPLFLTNLHPPPSKAN